MLKSLILVLGLALACQPFAVRAQEPPAAHVTAERDGDGLIVGYRLSEPRTRVVFTDRDTVRDRWTVATPGLVLKDGAVTADRPFDEFELRLLPDAAEVDRVYMGVSRAGEGRVVFGPGLMIEGVRVTLWFRTGPGEASLPEAGAVYGYAWVGPSADVSPDERGDLVTGESVPEELRAILREAYFTSMAFYQARLGSGLPFRPALIASTDSPGPANFRGDVTDTGVISVRFLGDAWRQEVQTVVPFVWHETFHLWNSHAGEARDGESAPWLHEGGADYAAVVGAVSTGAMDETEARGRIARRVNGCRRVLGDRPFDPERLQSGNGPYDCGVLIQWLADLEARRAGAGDVFTLWKAMLDAGRAGPSGYGVSDFRAMLQPDSAVAVLLDGPPATRWETVKARLTDLGVTIGNQAGDRDLRSAALLHVARRNCPTGSYGFYDNPGELRLEGGDCGVLSGEPVIDTVEGHDPQKDARAMFDAVQARCAADLPVRYAVRDGRLLEAVCDAPLTEPEVWSVTDAPPLGIRAD